MVIRSMIEEVHPVGDGAVEIIRSYSPWNHVEYWRRYCSYRIDVPENHRLRPQDLAAILAEGILKFA